MTDLWFSSICTDQGIPLKTFGSLVQSSALYKVHIKGIFSDSNIFLIRRYKQKSLLPKFQLIPILRFQVMYNYVYFIAPIDNCVELSLVSETFLWKLLLYWNDFGPTPLGKCASKRSAPQICQKFTFEIFWERPLFDISEYAFKQNIVQKYRQSTDAFKHLLQY